MLQTVIDQRELIEEQLGTMKTGAADVWSFLDFLYFSTITQTTVGYGDILPNSALVRKCVCLQIVVGCALLAVVLIVFAPH
jgi:hypothetical protein